MPFKPVESRHCGGSAINGTAYFLPQEKYISRIKPLSFHTAL